MSEQASSRMAVNLFVALRGGIEYRHFVIEAQVRAAPARSSGTCLLPHDCVFRLRWWRWPTAVTPCRRHFRCSSIGTLGRAGRPKESKEPEKVGQFARSIRLWESGIVMKRTAEPSQFPERSNHDAGHDGHGYRSPGSAAHRTFSSVTFGMSLWQVASRDLTASIFFAAYNIAFGR